MSKPETLKDIIEETMRVSGVSYKVPADNIIKTLDERGTRYGKFKGHAEISQAIKSVMFNSRQDLELAADQREALEMIAITRSHELLTATQTMQTHGWILQVTPNLLPID
jgi:hypothetical protein